MSRPAWMNDTGYLMSYPHNIEPFCSVENCFASSYPHSKTATNLCAVHQREQLNADIAWGTANGDQEVLDGCHDDLAELDAWEEAQA